MSIKNQTTDSNQQQLQQRLWVREQEINALKVQNRHLISKLEDAEKTHRPYQINTQIVANEVHQHLRPVLGEIEKSLKTAFEMLQGTLRGVYQQSQRAQAAVEEMQAHSKEVDMRMHDQRKADQVYYQEKIFASITSFCDRIERQIDNRLKSLAVVEMMNTKQNEVLADLEQIKTVVNSAQRNTESSRAELGRIEKESVEVSQKLVEMQIQTRNSEEVSRDGLQQIQNHRSEFKILRGEIRAMTESVQKLVERVTLMEGQVQSANVANSVASLKNSLPAGHELDPSLQADALEGLEGAIAAGNLDASQDELAMILELLRSQKANEKKEVKKIEGFLRQIRPRPTAPSVSEVVEARTSENAVIHEDPPEANR